MTYRVDHHGTSGMWHVHAQDLEYATALGLCHAVKAEGYGARIVRDDGVVVLSAPWQEEIVDQSFDLEYMHLVAPEREARPYQRRTRRVLMMRYKPDPRMGETEDSFGVHDVETGNLLGCVEDTKDEAKNQARYYLMDMSRKQFEVEQCQQNLDSGSLVRKSAS